MTSLIYDRIRAKTCKTAEFDDLLNAASKIVETVAFEMATQASAETIEELLGLAAGIENAAAKLKHRN